MMPLLHVENAARRDLHCLKSLLHAPERDAIRAMLELITVVIRDRVRIMIQEIGADGKYGRSQMHRWHMESPRTIHARTIVLQGANETIQPAGDAGSGRGSNADHEIAGDGSRRREVRANVPATVVVMNELRHQRIEQGLWLLVLQSAVDHDVKLVVRRAGRMVHVRAGESSGHRIIFRVQQIRVNIDDGYYHSPGE